MLLTKLHLLRFFALKKQLVTLTVSMFFRYAANTESTVTFNDFI